MSTHYGAMGQLSEHDGEILKVFTPRHWKIICSTPAKGPQCTIKQQALPGSMYFYKVNQSNLRLSALSLTLSELNPIYIHATVFFLPAAFTLVGTDIVFPPCSTSGLCVWERNWGKIHTWKWLQNSWLPSKACCPSPDPDKAKFKKTG